MALLIIFLVLFISSNSENLIFELRNPLTWWTKQKYGCENVSFQGKYYICEKNQSYAATKRLLLISKFDSLIKSSFIEKKNFYNVRFGFNDPDYRIQSLYSGEVAPEDSRPQFSHNLINIWGKNITGAGIVIGVVDDGVDVNHIDLSQNYDKNLSFNFVENNNNPNTLEDVHGTKCIGLISSVANNSICGVGIAFGAKFAALKILSSSTGHVLDSVESRAFMHKNDNISIYSMSWGPVDDGKSMSKPHALSTNAIKKGAKYGRNGLGSIFVWSSGNGGRNFDFCGYDGYLQQSDVFVVGSADRYGNMPPYAERCTALLTATLSNSDNFPDGKIYTTTPGNGCGRYHTGTSVSAPVLSGIIALLLQVRKDLSRRIIHDMIIQSSDQIDPTPIKNSAGYLYSLNFGFGLINPEKLIRNAFNSKYKSFPKSSSCKTKIFEDGMRARFGGTIYSRIYTTGCMRTISQVDILEVVLVTITLEASYRGAITAFLTSPDKTRVPILEPRKLDESDQGLKDWDIKVMAFYGEHANGIWDLEVEIEAPDNAKLVHWGLTFFGHVLATNESYTRHLATINKVCKEENYKKDSSLIDWCFKNMGKPQRSNGFGVDMFSFRDGHFVFGANPLQTGQEGKITLTMLLVVPLILLLGIFIYRRRRYFRLKYKLLRS